MPSIEYTQSKGLVQKSSTSATLDLQGELFGYRQNVKELGDATHQLTVADSGKELLLTRAGGSAILLPAVKGVKTDLKLTQGGVFTAGEELTFDAFGRNFKLFVVAEDGHESGKRVTAAGVLDANGTHFALRLGANGAGAIGNLRTLLLNGAHDFAALTGVTVSALDGGNNFFTIIALSAGAINNGTISGTQKPNGAAQGEAPITNLTLTSAPTLGQDSISNASGLRYRFVVGVALTTNTTIDIPTDRLGTSGVFAGTVLRTGDALPASADTMTIAQAHDNLGDYYEFLCDGGATPTWYVSGYGRKNNAVVGFA
jgi:hypothetical protein